MYKSKSKNVSLIILVLLSGLWFTISAMASGYAGQLEAADSRTVTGWAYSYSSVGQAVTVEIQVIPAQENTPVKTYSVTADKLRSDFTDKIGNTGHGFSCPVEWYDLEPGDYKVEAYIISGNDKIKISDDQLNRISTTDFEIGPGVEKRTIPLSKNTELGKPLGTFKTTGYCNCSICSSGYSLTYSGTVPKANHTIAADTSILPIGTKVLMNGIIYTVEDIGGSVNGNKIDIYYDTHQAALAHGLGSAEVYLIE